MIKNYFSINLNSLTKRVGVSIALSFIFKTIGVAVNVISIPITIHYVKPEQYGIWIVLSTLAAWMSFFDVGLSSGLRNKYIEAKVNNDYESARSYISTTYAILLVLFMIAAIIIISLINILNIGDILNTSILNESELKTLAIIITIYVCFQMILKTISYIMIADLKSHWVCFYDMLAQIISLLIILYLINTNQTSLRSLALAVGVPYLSILVLISIMMFSGRYKNISPNIKHIRYKYGKELLRLGAKYFIIQIGTIVLYQTTSVIISNTAGPVTVTSYNVAYKYYSIIILVSTIVLTPMWSAFTEAYNLRNYEWMLSTKNKIEKLWYVLVVIIVIMLIGSSYSYKMWVGGTVLITSEINILVAIYIVIFSRHILYIYIINGIGKIDMQLYLYIIVCISYIPSALIIAKIYQVEGIIVINSLIVLFQAIISQIQVNKILNKKAYGLWNK